ncbi:restriction endonuclease [Streptacidiphilus jiangxiensis]|uniref:Restriction system protein n=1 Tax=Streptacidiphilus jiangxiensis TaxID=235985 RepID=A0A1H7YQY9_STRJI|nr:restriction endonuclease [Streptacidiphilus jiangxiensis]SEM48331.1 protein of unknown function [Streptacidiphilus jiangxiensis]
MVAEYVGDNGVIMIDGPDLTLSRTGAKARLSGHLMGDRVIPLAALTGVVVSEPTPTTHGHLQLAFGGRPLVDLRHQGAVKDPNTVLFTFGQRAVFAALAGYLAHCVATNRAHRVDSVGAYASAGDPLMQTQVRPAAPRPGVAGAAATYTGYNGAVTIDGPDLTVSRTGLKARLSGHLMGDRVIPLAALTGLDVRQPTVVTNGYLQLAFGGAPLAVLSHLGAAPGDPNTILFTHGQRAVLTALAGYLAHCVATNRAHGIDSARVYAAAADPLILARRKAAPKREEVAAAAETRQPTPADRGAADRAAEDERHRAELAAVQRRLRAVEEELAAQQAAERSATEAAEAAAAEQAAIAQAEAERAAAEERRRVREAGRAAQLAAAEERRLERAAEAERLRISAAVAEERRKIFWAEREAERAAADERRRVRAAEAKAQLEARAREIATYDGMSGTEFERALEYLCKRDGCTGARVVGGTGDLGADVIATTPDGRRMVIQAKRYAVTNTIGSQVVQVLNGTYRDAHRGDLGVIITTSTFTAPAKDFAATVGIKLIDRKALAAWASETGPAPWE